MDTKKLLIAVFVVFVLAGAAFFASREGLPVPTAENPVQVNEATAEAAPQPISKSGVYTAECTTRAGTIMGEVTVDDDENPQELDTIEVKNPNTGKATPLKREDASCIFTPRE